MDAARPQSTSGAQTLLNQVMRTRTTLLNEVKAIGTYKVEFSEADLSKVQRMSEELEEMVSAAEDAVASARAALSAKSASSTATAQSVSPSLSSENTGLYAGWMI